MTNEQFRDKKKVEAAAQALIEVLETVDYSSLDESGLGKLDVLTGYCRRHLDEIGFSPFV